MLKVAGGGGGAGGLVYKGTWNASTNTPTLTSGVGSNGDYYVVSVAGTTNLDGITDWQVNDWAIFNGTAWQKIDNTDLVQSVNGQTGVVVLTAPDVGATPNTSYVLTSGLLSGGGQLTGNVTVGLTSVPVANVTGAVANTTTVSAGGLLSGGGALSGNVTISLSSVPVANVTGGVPDTRYVNAAGLLTGGGNLASDVTISLTSVPVANVAGAVPNTVNVLSGGLLSGGGALTGNVTISLNSVPAANVTGLGTMATQNANSVVITGGSINVTNISADNGIMLNSNTVYQNVTIPTGYNGLTGGPIAVANGITVTVSSNSVWTVV